MKRGGFYNHKNYDYNYQESPLGIMVTRNPISLRESGKGTWYMFDTEVLPTFPLNIGSSVFGKGYATFFKTIDPLKNEVEP